MNCFRPPIMRVAISTAIGPSTALLASLTSIVYALQQILHQAPCSRQYTYHIRAPTTRVAVSIAIAPSRVLVTGLHTSDVYALQEILHYSRQYTYHFRLPTMRVAVSIATVPSRVLVARLHTSAVYALQQTLCIIFVRLQCESLSLQRQCLAQCYSLDYTPQLYTHYSRPYSRPHVAGYICMIFVHLQCESLSLQRQCLAECQSLDNTPLSRARITLGPTVGPIQQATYVLFS